MQSLQVELNTWNLFRRTPTTTTSSLVFSFPPFDSHKLHDDSFTTDLCNCNYNAMNRFLSTLVLLLSVLTASSATSSRQSFSRGVTAPLFGIRGGGLFGGKDDSSSDDAAVGGKKLYPAMTQEEVEDWLEHIPVFAVTDSSGSGVVLKPDDDSSVFYFFLNPLSANATLTQLKSVNEDMDLKVSAFSLGKIWFKLLNSDPNQEVLVCTYLYLSYKIVWSFFTRMIFNSPDSVSHFPIFAAQGTKC